MLRIEKEYPIEITSQLKKQATEWANKQLTDFVWLDSNNYPDAYRKFEAILAFSPRTSLVEKSSQKAFEKLKNYIDTTSDWLFGYLSYDLKNDIENLQSQNFDGLHFPELYFFQPEKIIFFTKESLIFSYSEAVSAEISTDFETLCQTKISPTDFSHLPTEKSVTINSRLTQEEYLQKVAQMKQHIAQGDIYEANFCQEFYIENAELNPLEAFWELNALSEPPFASFMRLGRNYILSASPERYLQRSGNVVISQPIKGTAKRSADKVIDEKLRADLQQSDKERSENIMIVDLVRNDLSLYAERGSVQVVELCKTYTFKQVHQLISTIRADIRPKVHSVDVIRATFPMGSMTGAPKVSAMQIIDNLEVSKRGVYSGAIGYFSPKADFDFNVVIRSILYNSEKKYVSFSVGSAITANSDAQKEYEECLIKARAMKTVVENGQILKRKNV